MKLILNGGGEGELVADMDYPLYDGKIIVKADIMIFDIDEALKIISGSKIIK